MDEEEKENLIENTKSIKDLTKSINKLKGSVGTGSVGSGGSGSGGPGGFFSKSFKESIDGVKSAFQNNQTVQLVTDPVGTLSKGFDNLVSPLKNIMPDFDKFKEGIGNIFGKKGGIDKAQFEGLRDELQNVKTAIEGRPSYKPELIALESALGRIETAIAGQEFTVTDTAGLRADVDSILDNLTMPEVNTPNLRELSSTTQPQEGFFGAQNDIETGPQNMIPLGTLNLSDATLANLAEKNAEGIGDTLVNSIKGDDQLKREQERDRILREEDNNEKIVNALGKLEGGNPVEVKGNNPIAKFFNGIFSGGGIGGSAALMAVGKGIQSIITSIGSAFMFLGANFIPISLGAGAVALMGASLLPFVYTLQSFGNIDNLKDSLINFGIGLTSLAAAAGILGGIMMSGVGAAALTLGAIAIAGLGTAIIPLAGALALAAPGMEDFGNFLQRVSDIGFAGLTGVAGGLGALSIAMGAFAGGSLLAFLTPGKGKMVDQLESLSKTGPGLKSVADSLTKVRNSLQSLRNINFNDIGIGSFFKELNTLIKIRDFKGKIEKAGDGIKLMFKQMGEGLEKIDLAKAEAVASIMDSQLQVASGAFDGFEVNDLANAQAEMIRAQNLGTPTAQGGDTNIVASGDTVNNNTRVTNNPSHTNQATLQYLYGMGSFQGIRPTI
jgi:hypothetical protein